MFGTSECLPLCRYLALPYRYNLSTCSSRAFSNLLTYVPVFILFFHSRLTRRVAYEESGRRKILKVLKKCKQKDGASGDESSSNSGCIQ